MTIQVGDKIPSVTLSHMTADGPAEISTDEIFSGKKVVLFALPGYGPEFRNQVGGAVLLDDDIADAVQALRSSIRYPASANRDF